MTPIKPPSLCPRCREEMRVADWGAGFQAVCLECRWRSCRYPSAEKAETDIAPLAWFEPRDRLPTIEEEAAHRERHGDGAGWMGRQRFTTVGDGCITDWSGWRPVSCALDAHPTPLREWQSYPHVEGRPVGWPEVKHG